MTEPADTRPRGRGSRLKTLAVWLIGHGSRVVPFLVLGVVISLTWETLHQVHWPDVRLAMRGMDGAWLALAAAVTALNVAVMGLYDLTAFRTTRSGAIERWRYGAVAFAWSNFLTLGPFAGPAIRFWLYRPAIDRLEDLETGVLSITIAFMSGLVGWTLAALILPPGLHGAGLAPAGLAFLLTFAGIYAGRRIIERIERYGGMNTGWRGALALAAIGWFDWLLAGVVFFACLRATGRVVSIIDTLRSFFLGQAIGLASLVPGGFGSADAFWIAHLPLTVSVSTAALVAYRTIYYIIPWAAASLMLLSWATRRASRRIELARHIVAGLVGAGGVLILLSTASPALHARLLLAQEIIPLPLVEASTITAALTGLLLLVLARGLARGYRVALGATIIVLGLSAASAILKAFDWEEAAILGGVALAAWSQSPLFDRESHGNWFEPRDLTLAALAFFVFLVFGAFSFRLTPAAFLHFTRFGYQLQRARFLRSAGTLALAVAIGGVYLLLRVPVRFTRLDEREIDRALDLHGRIGHDTSLLTVANGDKAVFFDDERGLCPFRTAGPYLVVFADPAVRSTGERADFLNALFSFAGELDRTPVFYEISLEWIPPLHDRGYLFFKLGEEARVHLDRVTLDGHAGKMYRQILRRAERDRLAFRIVPPADITPMLPALAEVSREWLEAKRTGERQFSIGFFDEAYLRRFPCAIVEELPAAGGEPRLVAFANLLPGPHHEELSVDLMRYRGTGSNIMDFLFVSLFLHGKADGYARFNMGMAPLASVGQLQGAHARERLASLLFQHGENWYNFQGLRFYKQKFDPEWVPRYLAYQNTWEWPAVMTNVSALIAGGWARIMVPRKGRPDAGARDLAARRPLRGSP
ncbi:MAG TPA: bifunctional lysylphosphatidylglycerol flippase/synthetase MprF [Vicinamibacterales bacterium]|nr:bifunctional lysylphosphatidylglycerol flippase/synthetase MprF [Vicinamibacterales bacterium]